MKEYRVFIKIDHSDSNEVTINAHSAIEAVSTVKRIFNLMGLKPMYYFVRNQENGITSYYDGSGSFEFVLEFKQLGYLQGDIFVSDSLEGCLNMVKIMEV